MARPLRIEYPGALYHITSRGDRQEDIYHDDEDRENWLDIFSKVCVRFNWRCHAWCLMDNHYHILVETADGNLSQGMHYLNCVYTQRSNKKHMQVGHVFQGRYTAILIQKDEYLLEVSRYVVLNPVRAGMVKDVYDWPWSSYRAMIDGSTEFMWFESHWLLSYFDKQRKRAVIKYIDFVQAGVGIRSVWSDLKNQIYLGDDQFVESLQNKLKDTQKENLSEINRLQRRPLAKSLSWYESQIIDRKEAMALAYLSGEYTMKEISVWFCVHYSTVSRAVKSFKENV
ncbi:hypothetical protein MNBD_GAMMA12-3925 [hydrothermal vent metagenome]|uniref:Transposase IS200-like domain-containing protein n=1 Tax=hydrothermal vent metagenome TaxID=652676 RepID=A0A3B0YRT1_9ZZZZ